MSQVKQESLSGVKWQFITRLTLQPVTFILGMILARLITPDEMGIVGLTSIFFAVANQLKDCGFGAALIRKQDRTQQDCDTVFWFNMALSLLLCLTLCLSAPWIASFFDEPVLVDLTRVSALMLFLNSSASVHWTLYAARRDFKTPSLVSLATTLVPIPFTVWAAFAGWSYWALMVQGLGSGLLSLVIIWIISPWKPSMQFSISCFREFFGFGSKLLATNLVNIAYDESRNLIIGKFYSASQLALFHRGFKLGEMPISILNGIVGGVTYSVLSTIAHDESRLIHVYRQYVRANALVVFGGMLTLVANSHSIVYTLYGSTWLQCAFYAQILIFGIIFNPITYLMKNLLTIRGETHLVLRSTVIVRIVGMGLLTAAAFHSVTAICAAAVCSGMFHFAYLSLQQARLGWISLRDQFSDSAPYMILAGVANVPSLLLHQVYEPSLALCAVGVTSSVLLYLIVMRVRSDATWRMLIELLKEKKALRWVGFLSK